jgi:serine/threonine-protein kinase HipA
MAELRYAHILFKDDPAGILKEEPDGSTSFAYNENFLKAIACALPREKILHKWQQGLHPFFEHMGAEGALRQAQARRERRDIQDDFGLLMAYGYDCIGAVSAKDNEDSAHTVTGPFPEISSIVQPARTISGVQPKCLAYKKDGKFYPAEHAGPADWIAKFEDGDLHDMNSNEHLSMHLMRRLLPDDMVACTEQGFVEGFEKPALLIKRFDRDENGLKRRMEDFAQVLCKPRGRDFHGKYEADFFDVAEGIRKYSQRAELDVFRFFKRIVAFCLLHNADCHLKNWSLLEFLATDQLRLSPVYDVLNVSVYKGTVDTSLALSMAGKRYRLDEIRRSTLVNLGRIIGLSDTGIQAGIDGVLKHVPQVLKIVEPVGVEQTAAADFRVRYADTVRQAYERIR